MSVTDTSINQTRHNTRCYVKESLISMLSYAILGISPTVPVKYRYTTKRDAPTTDVPNTTHPTTHGVFSDDMNSSGSSVVVAIVSFNCNSRMSNGILTPFHIHISSCNLRSVQPTCTIIHVVLTCT